MKYNQVLHWVQKSEIDEFNCFPLLTTPRMATKDLLYLIFTTPRVVQVNDNVDKLHFEGYLFLLKFPTIEYIVKKLLMIEVIK